MTPSGLHVVPRPGILLSGAGFSQPFGGCLASEMWALIFRQPEVRRSERLRRRMLEEMNFEALYEEVVKSANYEPDEKQGLTEAIWRSYRQMHQEMSTEKNRALAYGVVRAFVSRFA